MVKKSFDGNFTLSQLQTSIGTVEQQGAYVLVGINKDASTKQNVGVFDDVALEADIPLNLQLVTDAADMPTGKTQVFDEVLYVEGGSVRVIGYR